MQCPFKVATANTSCEKYIKWRDMQCEKMRDVCYQQVTAQARECVAVGHERSITRGLCLVVCQVCNPSANAAITEFKKEFIRLKRKDYCDRLMKHKNKSVEERAMKFGPYDIEDEDDYRPDDETQTIADTIPDESCPDVFPDVTVPYEDPDAKMPDGMKIEDIDIGIKILPIKDAKTDVTENGFFKTDDGIDTEFKDNDGNNESKSSDSEHVNNVWIDPRKHKWRKLNTSPVPTFDLSDTPQ